MKSDWKLQYDSSLHEYYYVNTVTNDISFDLPSEVKHKKSFFKRCDISILSKLSLKLSQKSNRSEDSVEKDLDLTRSLSQTTSTNTIEGTESPTIATNLSTPKLEYPIVDNTIVDFNDESLIESSIFNTNYEFDSELESIDSNDVVSFDGNNYEYTNHYNVDEYYQEEDVDKQLFDWEKENERMQLRLQMLRELEI